MNRFLHVFGIAVLMMVSVCVFAQQKIAVVDMQKVFTGYDRTKTIELKVNEQLEIYKKYAAQMMQEIKTLRQEFETLRDEAQNVLLTPEEQKVRKQNAIAKLEELKRKDTELTEYNKSRQKQMKEHFDKLRSEVLLEIKQVVQNKCVLEGYTLALDKSGVSFNDLPVVVYSSPAIDITQSVLDELNRGYRSGKKTPQHGAK